MTVSQLLEPRINVLALTLRFCSHFVMHPQLQFGCVLNVIVNVQLISDVRLIIKIKYLTISYVYRLSGESPFLGESEADTFSRITDARWEFSDVFDYVSKEAKDFISRLLLKDPKYVLVIEFFTLQLIR